MKCSSKLFPLKSTNPQINLINFARKSIFLCTNASKYVIIKAWKEKH